MSKAKENYLKCKQAFEEALNERCLFFNQIGQSVGYDSKQVDWNALHEEAESRFHVQALHELMKQAEDPLIDELCEFLTSDRLKQVPFVRYRKLFLHYAIDVL